MDDRDPQTGLLRRCGHSRAQDFSIIICFLQPPNIRIDNKVVDIDHSHDQQHTFDRAKPGKNKCPRKTMEETIAEQEAHTVKPEDMVSRTVAVIRSSKLVLDVKDDHNGEILNAMKNGCPDKCL